MIYSTCVRQRAVTFTAGLDARTNNKSECALLELKGGCYLTCGLSFGDQALVSPIRGCSERALQPQEQDNLL